MSFGFGLSFPAWATLSGRIAAFSPASLFSSGEQGAWYDPSDTATLFQDSAGVTPVTAVEQPVGLILDKSKGLVLGSELVTNGTFDTDTDWTKGTNWVISGGQASNPGGVNGDTLVQSGVTQLGKWYRVTLTVVSISGGNARLAGSGIGTILTFSAAGTYSLLFTPTTTSGTIAVALSNTATVITVDNVSVRELPGNHAFQTDSAKRPLWSSRVNLLQRTEEFDNAYWQKQGGSPRTSVTANTHVAPDGTQTADTLTDGVTNNYGELNLASALSASANTQYVFSVYVLKDSDTTRFPEFLLYDATNVKGGLLRLNTSTGETFTESVGSATYTASVTSAGDYWRLAITLLTGASAVSSMNVFIRPAIYTTLTGSLSNAVTGSIVIWGADLRVANESSALPPYQRVVTATDYDTTGFVPFLRFDGSNDALVTNSIDFTATDEMSVFAGVRKLSDASAGIVAELSAVISTNNGSFLVLAPRSSTEKYGVGWKGTVSSGASDTENPNFTAPVTNTLTVRYDLSGSTSAAIAALRVNSASEPLIYDNANLGGGNFGNYPLYIGSRGGTTLPFNGRLFSLVVLGRTVTPTELTQTEGYVETKTFGKDMNYVLYEPVLGSDGEQITLTAGGDDLFVYQEYQ